MDKINSQSKIKLEELDFEANQNIVGFFNLLLKVDMRVNPSLYTQVIKEKSDD